MSSSRNRTRKANGSGAGSDVEEESALEERRGHSRSFQGLAIGFVTHPVLWFLFMTAQWIAAGGRDEYKEILVQCGVVSAFSLILAGWLLPAACVVWAMGGAAPSAGAWVAYGAYALQVAVLLRRVGRFGIWAPVLFPVLVAAFLAVFARSVLHAARGRTTWRGRTVSTRGARP